MKRFAPFVVLALLGAFTSQAAVGPPEADLAPDRARNAPNVLVIVTDDQRMDQWPQAMPATRRFFARGGRSFSRATVSTPMCCPSRATIFSGKYAHNHGVTNNFLGDQLNQDTTIQAYLRRAGYLTGMAGKFLNKWPIVEAPPNFDRWAMSKVGYYNTPMNIDGKVARRDRYSNHILHERSISFIRDFEDQDRRPWFMYISPPAVHAPSIPEFKYRRERVKIDLNGPAFTEEDVSDKPPFLYGKDGPERPPYEKVRNQLRTLMSVDDMVEDIFMQLRKLGEAENTLAIFISDNGYMWGEHGRVGKRLPYLPSVRVPMHIRWPDKIEGGVVDRRLAMNLDIAPTIFDAAGLDGLIDRTDGHSLLRRSSRNRVLLEYFTEPKRQQVPRWSSYYDKKVQYIEYYDETGEIIFREYYDLTQDPDQLENPFGNDNPIDDPNVAEIQAWMYADSECSGSGCP